MSRPHLPPASAPAVTEQGYSAPALAASFAVSAVLGVGVAVVAINSDPWWIVAILGTGLSVLGGVWVYRLIRGLVGRYESLARSRAEKLSATVLRLERELDRHKRLSHIIFHDLLNPISATLNLIELLRHDPDDGEVYLSALQECAVQSIGIISLVRRTQALEDGKLSLTLVSHPLKRLVERTVTVVGDHFRSKGLDLEVTIDPTHRVVVEEHSFANSVLGNILTNAAKFSHRGGRVRVSSTAGGRDVVLTVRDRGIGMPEEMVRRLFDMTFRSARPGTEHEAGTGFGMPLVRRLVEAYGGSIEVRSSEADTPDFEAGTEVRLFLRGFDDTAQEQESEVER